jgi:hypothetical protein
MNNFRITYLRYSSILLWTLTGMLMMYGIVNYTKLDRNVTDLRKERVVLSRQIEDLRFERDQASTSLILVLNSSIGFQDHVKKIDRVLDGNCVKDYKIRCARWLQYGELLVNLQDAISERVMAQTSEDFQTVRKKYGLVFDQIGRVDWLREQDRLQFEAISKEGIAYSALRSGRLEEAGIIIEDAKANYPNSGIIGSTYLKISCALNSKNNNFDAQKEFDNLALLLQERENVTSDIEGRRNAVFNRRLFVSDQEIKRFCDLR